MVKSKVLFRNINRIPCIWLLGLGYKGFNIFGLFWVKIKGYFYIKGGKIRG